MQLANKRYDLYFVFEINLRTQHKLITYIQQKSYHHDLFKFNIYDEFIYNISRFDNEHKMSEQPGITCNPLIAASGHGRYDDFGSQLPSVLRNSSTESLLHFSTHPFHPSCGPFSLIDEYSSSITGCIVHSYKSSTIFKTKSMFYGSRFLI